MIRTLTLVSMLLFSHACPARDFSMLLGAYADTLNKFNIKAGFTLRDEYEDNADSMRSDAPFKYADFEVGVEGTKITVGSGSFDEGGLGRYGLSYAHLRTQDLAGFELVVSQMAVSIKLGYYLGLHGTDNRLLLGLGAGF